MTSVECTCRGRIKWIIKSEEDKTFTPGSGGWYVQITTFLNHSNDVYQITVIFFTSNSQTNGIFTFENVCIHAV